VVDSVELDPSADDSVEVSADGLVVASELLDDDSSAIEPASWLQPACTRIAITTLARRLAIRHLHGECSRVLHSLVTPRAAVRRCDAAMPRVASARIASAVVLLTVRRPSDSGAGPAC
jgi:hypothetical protein